MAPFKLTPRMVAEAALPLLIAGKLQRQLHPDQSACFYRHRADSSPCVIGAALPDAVALRLQNAVLSTAIDEALDSAEIVFAAPADRWPLIRWQKLHDTRRLVELRTALEAELAKPVAP